MSEVLDEVEMIGQRRGEEIGQRRGEEIGQRRGEENMLYRLVHEGLLTQSVGASKANMPEDVFMENMRRLFS